MTSKYIFDTIKQYLPELTSGATTYIFPQTLPEGLKPPKFITYTLLRSPQTFGLSSQTYQISIFAKTYSDIETLSLKVQGLFAHKVFSTAGDPIATNSGQIVELPFDRESGYFMRAVDITINTKKQIENYLQ